GANAGHTVDVAGDEFILHQIPSGILHPDKRCLLGNGVVLDLDQFFEELDGIQVRGIVAEGRVGISGRAHLLLEYHKRLDQASEKRRGASKIGTTGKGIGPAYEDKVARRGIRAGDLRDPERAADLIRDGAERANERLRSVEGEVVEPERLVERVLALRDRVLPLITDTGEEIHQALRAGRTVLLEGAQGALLDIDHGTFPYVTSSNTTAAGAATGTGIGPTAITSALGVVKAYTTRVGSGPLPTELEADLGERLRELGGEYGATTGRPRRCGWFDAVVVRYAARVNGLTGLALTKLDVLDSFEEIRICTGYTIDGQLHESFPDDLARLERARPVFETMAGWSTGTSGARSVDDLPRAAREYMRRLETLAGVPIEFVSVGTQREQIITVV
ncbi:MAG: adenylosuccinate synthase, partial [Gemmatimonadota bacterium]